MPRFNAPNTPRHIILDEGFGEELLDRIHRWNRLETSARQIVPHRGDYTSEYLVPRHRHSLGQLVYAEMGVFMMLTEQGRWIVPPDHAFWVPAGIEHSMQTHGHTSIRALYIKQGLIPNLPGGVRVMGMTALMRSLIEEAVQMPGEEDPPTDTRGGLILALMRDELGRLPEKPLGLPMPAEPKLAALCREFLERPTPHATIDRWADAMAMSRRAFTRAFRRETGLSLSTWRQQACLFAALPRLAAGESITGIALDLGYDSTAAFTTMFRRILGTPPSRYLYPDSL
jgi:AraC-like DNA-binding protein